MQTGDPRLDAAILIAREAGALALRWQAGDLGPLATQQKPDDAGPVTRGDRETEELIVKRLQALFPSDDIVGEETGHHRGDPTHRWFIDPIDGTRDYAAGGNDWAVQLGVCEGDELRAGVVFQPRTGRLTWGRLGETASAGVIDVTGRGEAPLTPRDQPEVPLRLVTSRRGRSVRTETLAASLPIPPDRHLRAGSTGVKLIMLARDMADLYLYAETKTRVWDTCAPMAALLAVGGVVTDLRGAPLDHSDAAAPHARGILAGRTAGAHAWALARLQASSSSRP